MKRMTLHLVSDSTGETVSSVARAALVQFESLEAEDIIWPLVRSLRQMEKVIHGIQENPGPVLYTLVDPALRDQLKEFCQQLNVPCIPVLSTVMREIAAYTGASLSGEAGRQYELDAEYFSRVEAVNFAISHDDGQATWELEKADIVLVGASRTSKSPTCMYLAHRGYSAANVPYVKHVELPESLDTLKRPLIVGLCINPEALVQIRKNRLLSLHEDKDTDYVDMDVVKEEVTASRRYFQKRKWPIIDVTRRSVEETAAQIIQLYQDRESEKAHG
ncbi:MAG: kinase/pyrophosphorylase [Alphaproteobacteria bacterium]|nr:kinase/pyrophosphorylase [Alphaproteobacteria bacterium]